jgi:hypothetical protein
VEVRDPNKPRIYVQIRDPRAKGRRPKSTGFTVYNATVEEIAGWIKSCEEQKKRQPQTA